MQDSRCPSGTSALSGRLDVTPGRLDGTPGRLDGTPGRLDGTPGRLDGTPGRLDGTPDRLDGISGVLDVQELQIPFIWGWMTGSSRVDCTACAPVLQGWLDRPLIIR